MKKTIFGIVAVLAVFAMISCGGGGGGESAYTVTFSANGGTGTPPPSLPVSPGQAITIPAGVGLSKTDFMFDGWSASATAATAAYAVGDSYTPTASITLYAVWKANPSYDLARAEKVELANGWYAVYRFVLPYGKVWEDYKGLSASYLFTKEDLAAARAGNGRIMGPYEPEDFTLVTGSASGKKLAVADYDKGKNEPYILDDGKLSYLDGTDDAGTLVGELEDMFGITAKGGEWFTITYDITGDSKNADYANMPDALDNGVFYFGVGLSGAGAGNPANVQYIRDVTLIGNNEADNVIAAPLWFEKDGDKYPAFTGYGSADGSNGYSAARRELVTGTAFAIPLDAEKIALDNAWYVVYKFTLPAGKYWEDYRGLTAEYLFEEAELEGATARGARLMGPYYDEDFQFFTGDEEGLAPGKKVALANYNNKKNGPYILDNRKSTATDFWGKDNAGTLVTSLAAIGTNAVGGEWFTLSYDTSGSGKHSEYEEEHYPDDKAAGPFYFGVGLPGQEPSGVDNNGGNIFFMKNVRLIGYEVEDTIVGTPAYIKNTADPEDDYLYPVFTGYDSWKTGNDGYKEASRGPAK